MTTQLVSDNFAIKFSQILNKSKGKIKIVSPFIGYFTANKLAECIKGKNLDCKIITRFYREDFIQKASSIYGLEKLLHAGATIAALQDLHSKLYIFDSDYAILGSANYTFGGLYLNHEIGVIFDEEEDIINECIDYFDAFWNKIIQLDDWRVNQDWIDEEKEIVDRSINGRKRSTTNYNENKRGAKIPKGRETTTDNIERLLSINNTENDEAEIWIKFEASSKDRIDNDLHYLDFKKDWPLTYFSQNPRGIKEDDLVFIAIVSYNKSGIETPLIIGYTNTYGFSEQNIASETEKKNSIWKKKYPYYVELLNGKIINCPIKEGVPLTDLIRDVGSLAFPTTIDEDNVESERLRTIHHQKSHIRITAEAAKYLKNKLNKIFNEREMLKL